MSEYHSNDVKFNKFLRDSGLFFSDPHYLHEKYHKVWKAAQHHVHRTAIMFGTIGLGLGIVVGAWLVVVAQIAAR